MGGPLNLKSGKFLRATHIRSLLAAVGSPGSIPHHKALAQCLGLLVDWWLHVQLPHVTVHRVDQLFLLQV